MRIGLNATCFDDRPSGANQRFAILYGALIRQHPDVAFVIYEPIEHRIAQWFGDAPNVSARRTPIPAHGRLRRAAAGLGYWRRACRADRLDLLEVFSLPLLGGVGCPILLTVHDLRPVEAQAGRLRRWLGRAVLHRGFAVADRVLTVSDTVKARVEAFRPGTAVTTIYNAVPVVPASAAPLRAGLPPRFMLTVGHLEARKNLPLLVDAVALMRLQGRERPLVIVGSDGGDRAAVIDRIARHGLADLVTVIEDAGDAELRALYAAAWLTVIPSRYEGFGIPLVEAMAAGCPLVSSDIPVFRELRQDYGPRFPPDDAAAAAAAIERGWSDADTRAMLIAHGRRRAADFRPGRLADQLAALHRATVSAGRGP